MTDKVAIALLTLVLGAGGGGLVGKSWVESQLEERTEELNTLRERHIELVRSCNTDLEDCRRLCVEKDERAGVLFRSAPERALPDVGAPPPGQPGKPEWDLEEHD